MRRETETQYNSKPPEVLLPGGGPLTMVEALGLLREARVKNANLLSNASNYTFLAGLARGETKFRAIYKPLQGEIPLWDFPDGTLYKREYAAFLVSQALAWYLVPPTVIRDGPHGIGSMQWFIDSFSRAKDGSMEVESLVLKRVALFDYLVNNADRKAGHFLEGRDGRLWLVDHGLTFNAQPKLRTVVWNFSGETIPEELLTDVRAMESNLKEEGQLRGALGKLIDESEIQAFERRINKILAKPVFVQPGPQRNVPWPWF